MPQRFFWVTVCGKTYSACVMGDGLLNVYRLAKSLKTRPECNTKVVVPIWFVWVTVSSEPDCMCVMDDGLFKICEIAKLFEARPK